MPRVTLTFGKGVIKDIPPAALPEGFCSDANSVRFEDGVAQKIGGVSALISNAAAATHTGLHIFPSGSNTYFFWGTAATIAYSLSGAATTTLSSGYTGDANTPWSFANFGTTLLCTNGTNNPQVTISPYSSIGDIGGSPPVSKVVQVFQRHAFLVGQTTLPQKVSWSTLDDYTDWTPTTSNDAGGILCYESKSALVAAGSLQNLFMAYSPNMTFAFQYVGGTYVFARGIIDFNNGARSQGLLVNANDKHYYMGSDNFYACDGARTWPIGDGVKKYIFSTMNAANMGQCFSFPIFSRSEAWFCIPTGVSSAIPVLACIYNWKTGAWSFKDLSIGGWFAGINAQPYSAVIVGLSNKKMYLFDAADNELSAAVIGYVDSAEQGADAPEIRKQVLNVFPVIESSGTSAKVYIGFRNNLKDAVTWSSAYSFNPGTAIKVDTRSAGSGRYWRVRIATDAASTPFKLIAVHCDVESAGDRA